MTALGPRTASILGLLVAAAVLYLAREVLIPFALAILLSFLLAPVVRRLEHWRVGRVLATLAAVAIAFSVIAGVGWVAARQALSLAAKLPEYRHNIQSKIRAVRAPQEGTIGKAADAIKELENEAAPQTPAPLPVTETPPSAFAALAEWIEPFAKPVGGALAVLVFTILLLLNREDMRERLLGLAGAGRINVATRALGEASYRVSRYLYMQLLVNLAFGVPFGLALYFIGIPNALLWGLLGTLFRFVPYIGVWVAVALPATLAFAIFDGWSEVAWVLGVFLALELVLVYVMEPWLYGRSAGLSPIAVILAALFWTWLWGPVGLLLAVPLTVCIAVLGRYMPELGYLNMLLGVEPVLSPEARFYQRLIALDQEESVNLAQEYAREHGFAALCDAVLVPALSLAETDRHHGSLGEGRARFVLDSTRQIVEELQERTEGGGSQPTCIVPAHDEADEVAGLMLARLLPGARVFSAESLAGELLDQVGDDACRAVCVSAVPPDAASHAVYLVRRLRQRFPELRIVVGVWTAEFVDKVKPRLLAAGANEVVVGLRDAAALLQSLELANDSSSAARRAAQPA